jgi:predicted ATPase
VSAVDADLGALRLALRLEGQRLDRAIGEAQAVAAAGKALAAEVEALQAQVHTLDKVATLLASVAENRQSAVQQQIEMLVTEGLQAIFGEGLSFAMVPTMRNKTPVIDLVIRSRIGDELVETEVMDARGGGLAATVGALLRVVVMLLSPDGGDTLCLDEPFAHVSAEYQPPLAAFLRELVDRAGKQIIHVTHSDVFAEGADRRYRFDQVDGVTRVSAV